MNHHLNALSRTGKHVLPGKHVFLGLVLTAALYAAPVHLTRSADKIDIAVDGKPFTTYYFGPTAAKPYLMPLRTAKGIIISRDFPVGNDVSHADSKDSSFEPHQRPLYFAHGDLDGLNFWGESVFQPYYDDHSKQPYGHSTLSAVDEASEASDSATVRATFSLQDPNGRIVGEEVQSFKFSGVSNTRVIDCQFTLRATHGPIVLGDTKEGTFGIRLNRDLSAPLGHMRNSHGAEGEPAIWGHPADWVNYYGTSAGRPMGIVVFDSPKSFRHPTTWHARDYGLLAANPFGLREFTKDPKQDGSWTIVEGSLLTFRYRVLIYDGALTPAQIAQEYAKYASQ